MPQRLRTLTLPDFYDPGVKSLIGLSDIQAKELISALKDEQPVYYLPDQLAAHIAPKVSALDRSFVRDIIRTLSGLHMTRAITGLPVPDFVEVVMQAVEKKQLKPTEPQSWINFEINLTEFLKLDGAL